MKPHRRLALPVASTAIANGLVTVTAALGGIVVARALGPSGRGDYAVVLVVFAVLQVLAEGGVQGATTFFAARDDVRLHRLVRTAGHLLAAQGGVVSLAWLLALFLSGTGGSLGWAFAIITLGLTPTLWLSARLFALQGTRIAWWNASRLLQAVLYLTLLTLLASLDHLGVVTAAMVFASSSVVGGLIAAAFLRSVSDRDGASAVPRQSIRKYSWPNFAWTVPVTVSARVDQMALALFASSADVGIYAVALSLITLAVPVVAAIGNVTMPALSRAASQGQATGSSGRRVVVAGCLTALIISIVIASLSGWVIPVLFGTAFEESSKLCWMLVPASVTYATKWVAAEALRGLGAPGSAAKAEWIGLIVVLAVTLPAVAAFGLVSAALAPVIGYSVAIVMMLRSLHRMSAGGLQALQTGTDVE